MGHDYLVPDEQAGIKKFVLFQKDNNADGKDNLDMLPGLPAVYAVGERVNGQAANLRYIGEAGNLRESIKKHFDKTHSEEDECFKEFMLSIKIKVLIYELIPSSTHEERLVIKKEWENRYKRDCNKEGWLKAVARTPYLHNNHYTIIDLFYKQLRKTPGHIAVSFQDEQITYLELNERVSKLAAYLRQEGVCGEALVPVCMYRSLEMIISIMAILKAGGAYVPIDPEYPPERIEYILSDTRAKMVLTISDCEMYLPPIPGIANLCVDRLMQQIIDEPFDDLPPIDGNGHLAYVIYTSGSTGVPKGVMIEHAAIVNRLLWAQAYFGLTDEDVVLQKTTFCFDVSVWELFWPLCTGAKLVFANPGGHKDNNYLKGVIQAECISTIHFVPSMLEVFLSDLEKGDCSNLKRVLCSGEALRPAQVALFKEKLPHVQLHNLYGPTEAAIDVTCWTVPETGEFTTIPIGKPVANTSLYILDTNRKLVPVGVPGELYISGSQLARGYLNKPALTNDKFVNDPFTEGRKMYRTGDIARWREDGNIEYLGRNDDQVKINGYRIELGEIETVLGQMPGIHHAVVIATQETAANRKLVGYVVPKEIFDKDAIIKYLKERLPDYMVPASLVKLENIPLTSNGKVDKKALPLPDISQLTAREYAPPRNETETILATIWQELLDLERVSIHDSFFELGGNSLIIMRMLTQIRRKLFLEVPMRVLFDYTTIEDLGRYLELTQSLRHTEEEEDFSIINI